MFYLSRIEHSLRLSPSLLSHRLKDAVKGELEKLFLDKVISNLGLCISVYVIDDIKDHFILPNDGHPTLTVLFTLIMFRPFVGEIITAKVIESTADGLRLSLGFFEDIYIPIHRFPTPCFKKGDAKKNVVLWYWKPSSSDDELPIDLKDHVRFQVESVNYPKIPTEQPENSKPFAPMEVKTYFHVENHYEELISCFNERLEGRTKLKEAALLLGYCNLSNNWVSGQASHLPL